MTEVGVLGDIHGNLPALEAVFEELDSRGITKVYCTGDITGHVGWSKECINRLQKRDVTAVAGNHDCRYRHDHYLQESFPAAHAEKTVVESQLAEPEYEYLNNLPFRVMELGATVAHSWPCNNRRGTCNGFTQQDRGVMPKDFPTAGAMLDTRAGFLGHTHIQHAVSLDKFSGQTGLLLNPGSVGIPRDGMAEYAVVDMDSLDYELRAAEFDKSEVTARVEELAAEHDLPILTT